MNPTAEQPPAAFEGFPKMGRLSRECIITEKIDGTNAQIYISDTGEIRAGSRTRWITLGDDNFSFARWVEDHKDELVKLGPGRHFGEWWGAGIQRKYGQKGKRFSLFDVSRWCLYGNTPERIPQADPRVEKFQDILPQGVELVPVLYRGLFTTEACSTAIERLRTLGSVAAPGFMDPEGIVCFHIAAGVGFKKTVKNDEKPKSQN
jgi:hypothetical protein